MKIRSLLIGLVILNLTFILEAQQKKWKGEILAEKRHDRFTGFTTISVADEVLVKYIKMFDPRVQPRIQAYIVYKDKEKVPDVLVTFLSISREWKFLKYRYTLCLIDDEPVAFPDEPERDGEVSGGGVIEKLSVTVSYGLFTKLCTATKLEFRIGNTEFLVSEFEKELLKQIKALFEEN